MFKKDTVTRGWGLLETFLSRLRTGKANALIPEKARAGNILDIGSGATPFFLKTIKFNKKYGLDKFSDYPGSDLVNGIKLKRWDVASQTTLPFDNESMDVITMLAVFEHIDTNKVVDLILETRRVLTPRGALILTVPSGWTDPILKLLATVGMLSAVEVYDHKDRYSLSKIVKILEKGGFKTTQIEGGYFELGMNIWIRASKGVH
jgi:ubiquinone/menaquinone biosynthesis C-methylase UbiE